MWVNQPNNTPDWVLSQLNINYHNLQVGNLENLIINHPNAEDNARHLCYAFAGTSVINRLGGNTTVLNFFNGSNHPNPNRPLAGSPFPFTTANINFHSPLFNNEDTVRQGHNNVVLNHLNHNNRLGLILCRHANAATNHVFILRNYNNILTLYNVWDRSKWIWQGDGNPMHLFPNPNNQLLWIPREARIYWS